MRRTKELQAAIDKSIRALSGDSNDAEHDALIALLNALGVDTAQLGTDETIIASFDCGFCHDGPHNLAEQIRFLREEGSITVSRIQRRFMFGYAHALAIFEALHAQKLISASGVSLLPRSRQ
jgi:hypothetical protein